MVSRSFSHLYIRLRRRFSFKKVKKFALFGIWDFEYRRGRLARKAVGGTLSCVDWGQLLMLTN